jgi:hypothetical protein
MLAGSDSETTGRNDREPFLIEQAAAYYHPDYRGQLLVQLVFDTVFVNGPGLGQSGNEVITYLPVGKWTQLRDGQGQPLPVAVLREDGGRLLGAWL